MDAIISIINRLSTKRGYAVLIILYVIIFGSIVATMSKLMSLTGGIGILDFDRGYTLERVREVFESYGAAGFELYGRIQLLDLVNPALYSLLLACVINWLWQGKNQNWVVLFPLAAGLLDYSENLTLYLLSSSYPSLSAQIVTFSSWLSLIKNVALFGTIAILLIGIVFWVRRKRAPSA